MFELQSYVRVLLSVCSGLLTLLGSVGIFVSLTVERRIERLQDTLEEFIDLSYHSSQNLTGQMYRLIEKYQMYYQLPDSPSKKIIGYINLTIASVIALWLGVLVLEVIPPWTWTTVIYLLPISIGFGLLYYYRYLLKNAINPTGSNLFSPLIPPPTQLRSISFLSAYVNVSVKTILKHARLRLVIKSNGHKTQVILKEELSFDDFFYFVELISDSKRIFAGFGEISLVFPPERITGKPVPVIKNVNIPLGDIDLSSINSERLQSKLYVFPRGEKHPVEYHFTINYQGGRVTSIDEPEINVNYMILYKIAGQTFELLDSNAGNETFERSARHFALNKRRFFWLFENDQAAELKECMENAYVD